MMVHATNIKFVMMKYVSISQRFAFLANFWENRRENNYSIVIILIHLSYGRMNQNQSFFDRRNQSTENYGGSTGLAFSLSCRNATKLENGP